MSSREFASATEETHVRGAAPTQPLEKTLQDNSIKLTDYHRNQKGDYTLTFEDNSGRKMVYANVNPSLHERLSDMLGLPKEEGRTFRGGDLRSETAIENQIKGLGHTGGSNQPLENTLKDNNYKLVDKHRNVKGDYTLVFENNKGVKQVYANVNPSLHPQLKGQLE